MESSPEVEAPHHHATGHRWLDVTLSVAAISISLTTAVLAFQHGAAMEEMVHQNAALVQANTWPYVSADYSNANERGQRVYSLEARNSGVGPARVAWVAYRYDGRRVADRRDLVRTVVASTGRRGATAVAASDIGGVLPARESVKLLSVSAPSSPTWLVDAFVKRSASIDVSICYCSILGECWIGGSDAAPRPVASCAQAPPRSPA